jgi:hypothetical protein
MTPQEARKILLTEAARWFPRMELVYASSRKNRRHDLEEDRKEAAHNARCDNLKRIAGLPDEDLQWLLDSGWSPLDT